MNKYKKTFYYAYCCVNITDPFSAFVLTLTTEIPPIFQQCFKISYGRRTSEIFYIEIKLFAV